MPSCFSQCYWGNEGGEGIRREEIKNKQHTQSDVTMVARIRFHAPPISGGLGVYEHNSHIFIVHLEMCGVVHWNFVPYFLTIWVNLRSTPLLPQLADGCYSDAQLLQDEHPERT